MLFENVFASRISNLISKSAIVGRRILILLHHFYIDICECDHRNFGEDEFRNVVDSYER